MNDQYKNSYKATAKELVSLSVYNVGYQPVSYTHLTLPTTSRV